MIGSPLYRLLVAAGLMLSAAVATARVGPDDPKAPCDDRQHGPACALPHAPASTAAPRRVDDRGAAVAVAAPW